MKDYWVKIDDIFDTNPVGFSKLKSYIRKFIKKYNFNNKDFKNILKRTKK